MRLLILASLLLVGIRAQLLLPHGECTGRCFLPNDYSQSCQCDYDCETYGNCCTDFWLKCRGSEYGLVVTKQEMNDFAQRLWDNDVNRISSDQYTLNTQATVNKTDADKATDKLIVPNNVDNFNAMLANTNSTYPSFIRLLNNYNPVKNQPEIHPDKEVQEEVAFWNAISKTQVVNIAFRFLVDQGYLKGDIHAFHTLLNEIWFTLYPYTTKDQAGSDSGFERVFVGETIPSHMDNETGLDTGFNNWVRFYEEENKGTLDYMGNIKSLTNVEPNMVDARFSWHDGTSRGSSFFVGTSPEFDLCIYTVCAVVFPNKQCVFNINNHRIVVRTMRNRQRNIVHVVLAYPVVPSNPVVVG